MNGASASGKGSVLVLGSGLVCGPLVHYLSSYGFSLTLASRTVSKAEAIISSLPPTSQPLVTAVAYDVDADDEVLTVLSPLIASHSLTVSLLPYTYHVKAAKVALHHRRHFFTTSYISPAMQELHAQAKQHNLVFMNEAGLDPGQ
jgi:saccharopine dehydrogenase-like NADP-dependent oxidoreductase